MVDSSWSVMKLVLQGSRDGCSADRLGGSQGRLLGVKDWRLSCHYATRGCAGGRGRVRWGWRGACLTQGSVLTLSICWDAEGQGRGLKVPATTFPPARHILERKISEIDKINMELSLQWKQHEIKNICAHLNAFNKEMNIKCSGTLCSLRDWEPIDNIQDCPYKT